jgi:hypothetical protein
MRAATCARVDGRHAGIMLACVRHVQMRRLAAAAAAGAAAAGGASPSQPGDAAAAAASSSPSSSPSSQRRAAAAPSPSDLRAQLRGGGGGFAAMASVATVGTSSSEIYFGLAKAIDVSRFMQAPKARGGRGGDDQARARPYKITTTNPHQTTTTFT